MPFAVTHILVPVILIDLFRDYVTKHKKRITLLTVLLAGIGGLLPDIDFLISWFLSLFGYSAGVLEHRVLTHAPVFGLIFLIPFIYFWYTKKHKMSFYFLALSFGIFSHIFLDFFISNGNSGVMLLWPFSSKVFAFPLVVWLSDKAMLTLYSAIDAILLLSWLVHEEIKHKIKDFI